MLSLIPCGASKDFQPNNKQETRTTYIDAISDPEEHEDDCGDNCSMLCICTCCGISMAPPPAVSILQVKNALLITSKPQFAHNCLANLFIPTFWHPPQLDSFLRFT